MTPTQRSLEYCRQQGWPCDIVERWVPGQRVRKDLFGFIDAVCIMDGRLVGLQITSRSNVSARRKKITKDCAELCQKWLETGSLIEVWGWGKMKRRGPDGKYWQLRRVSIES